MADMALGLFTNRQDAEDAIDELEALGYNPKDFSIIMRDEQEAKMTDSKGANVVSGAATGATTGAGIGALAGLLVGIGAIAVPGLGALFIGGPLAAGLGLTGAAATTISGAVTGTLAGGLIGALAGLGMPEEDAKYYEARIKEGAILLAVPSETRVEEVKEVLSQNGAEQVKVFTFDKLHYSTATM